ncbi:MAG: hypothetical protein AAFX87_24965 [Bacteroidota bacterium]
MINDSTYDLIASLEKFNKAQQLLPQSVKQIVDFQDQLDVVEGMVVPGFFNSGTTLQEPDHPIESKQGVQKADHQVSHYHGDRIKTASNANSTVNDLTIITNRTSNRSHRFGQHFHSQISLINNQFRNALKQIEHFNFILGTDTSNSTSTNSIIPGGFIAEKPSALPITTGNEYESLNLSTSEKEKSSALREYHFDTFHESKGALRSLLNTQYVQKMLHRVEEIKMLGYDGGVDIQQLNWAINNVKASENYASADYQTGYTLSNSVVNAIGQFEHTAVRNQLINTTSVNDKEGNPSHTIGNDAIPVYKLGQTPGNTDYDLKNDNRKSKALQISMNSLVEEIHIHSENVQMGADKIKEVIKEKLLILLNEEIEKEW